MASSGTDPAPIDPPQLDLAQLRALFLKALELPESERAGFLERADVTAELREEALAMLREAAGAESCIQATVAGAIPPSSGDRDNDGIGQRFGAFETRRLLGRGGMGVVYLAERCDGELAQTVAIKVIERGWLARRALERFRLERQMLAELTHSGIARLIDGGTREDGVPYLVMEFVDGEPIDRYCNERKLGVRERLSLFLPLCDAVEYAHRKLIVHRDLKPSNVLMTAAGNAKLLDFGVARTLEAGGGQTQTMMFTPDFASPEQARGEDASTATDIYGLGGVLYHLLTGQRPHATEGLSPTAMQRAICDDEVRRPSHWNAELKGDLDNILLKALHVDPQRRYLGAREFAADIEKFISNRPVIASPDSWSYRSGRFVRRNRVASIAATLALAAIVGGAGVSWYQARQAQRRAADVRTLANRFIFDFDEAIINTPGTLAAQKMVAATAREYLAKLSVEASRDRGVSRDLAQSYYRLSGIERRLGDMAAAKTHVSNSVAILEELREGCCGPAAQRKLYIEDLIELSRLQMEGAALQEALQTGLRARDSARKWVQSAPEEPVARATLRDALENQGNILEAAGKHPEAKTVLTEALELADASQRERPSDPIAAEDASDTRSALALTLEQLGETTEALSRVGEAEAILDGLIAGAPENKKWRHSRIMAASLRSRLLNGLANADPVRSVPAIEAQREAYTMARKSADANPMDLVELDLAATMAGRLANRLANVRRLDEWLAVQRETVALIDRMLAVEGDNRRFLYLRANAGLITGMTFTRADRWREASETLLEAERFSKRALAKDSGDVRVLQTNTGIMMLLTRTERNLGNLDRARERCREALTSAEELIRRNRNAKEPVTMIEILHSEAKLLGVADTTLPN